MERLYGKVNLHRIPSHPLINRTITESPQSPKQSFLEHLNEALKHTELKISKHATERLERTKYSYIRC